MTRALQPGGKEQTRAVRARRQQAGCRREPPDSKLRKQTGASEVQLPKRLHRRQCAIATRDSGPKPFIAPLDTPPSARAALIWRGPLAANVHI